MRSNAHILVILGEEDNEDEHKEYAVAQPGMGDMVRFERKFGIPASVFDQGDPTPLKIEWMAYLMFLALSRRGVCDKGDFEGFLDQLVNIRQVSAAGDDDTESSDDEEAGDSSPLDQPLS